MELQDSIITIKGIGGKTAKIFEKLGIQRIQELLEHYPRGYEVFKEPVPIAKIREGEIAAIEASLAASPQVKKIKAFTLVSCQVRDYSGSISLTWFNMPFLKNSLKMGTYYLFRGRVVRKNGVLVMEQPAMPKKQEYFNQLHKLRPVYSLTAGLTNHGIEKAVRAAIEEVDFQGDYLPVEIRRKYSLKGYQAAIGDIHFPKDQSSMLEARKRIVFDEFFLLALAISQMKLGRKREKTMFPIAGEESVDCLLHCLPYTLTNAQQRVWEEIKNDMKGPCIMNRLVQGDVGSGKTVLAALSLLAVAKAGYQGCLMVPTEVLARQHYETLTRQLEDFGIHVILLAGSMTAKEKREAREKIKSCEAHIIVGTHALIQEKVEYACLALVITDEQHRFGVKQREALAFKGKEPHILVMSATPIPRTLAIILYGDLDISIVDELPAQRLPIKNCVVNTGYRNTAYRFIEKEVQKGRQAYVICPMVEESQAIEAENVLDYTQQLRNSLSPGLTVEYLHGKMKAGEKNMIMDRFAHGEIQVLVSTTVVEVGVDVPNASVIMIENAERFGLAQLHQLRGRVGRGKHQSYCILVSGSEDKETIKRLSILNSSNDGFYIAGEDLKLRGPGDLFGIRQSGMLEFKLADIYQDGEILKAANEAAQTFTQEEYRLLLKKYKRLREKILFFTGGISL